MRYIIRGGKPLSGTVRIQGAKNSVLPILAASILSSDVCEIYDCPHISDVDTTEEILKALGCSVTRREDAIRVDASSAFRWEIPQQLMQKMRSSIVFLGAITMKMGKAKVSMPGGCPLGARPVDLHLKALRDLNISVREEAGYIITDAKGAKSANVHLAFPSVGATENAIMAAVKLKGETVITNSAREPEIVDLINFLNAMGGKISGGGTGTIHIDGVPSLKGISYRIIPDRIAATTFMCAAMATRGEIELENVKKSHMTAIVDELRQEGAAIEFFKDRAYLRAPGKILPAKMIKTMPYPGFPTDAQSVFIPHLINAEGVSVIVENIFENRFKTANDFNLMGADIVTEGRTMIIRGGTPLHGAHLTAPDLRSGAAFVLAALCAKGVSVVDSEGHIERGYEMLEENLLALGADIRVE